MGDGDEPNEDGRDYPEHDEGTQKRPRYATEEPSSGQNNSEIPAGEPTYEQRFYSPQELEDPVKRAHEGRVDLYDIATWESRSSLDRFAIRLTEALRTTRTSLLLIIAVSLFMGQLAIAGLIVVEEPILGVLALVSVVPAAALAGYFWYGDPTIREPPRLLAITFLLAILFASLAAVVNTLFFPAFEMLGLAGLILFYFLVVGPVEETVKWLAIRTHAYNSDSFQTVVDGAVYGAVAGVGFAAIENLAYILQVFVLTEEAGTIVQQQYAVAVAGVRALVGPGHVIFSAWAGFYLGLAKFNPENRGPIVVKGLLIAACIHALYNTLVTFIPTNVSFIGFAIVYHGFWFTLLWKKISRYRDLYQQATRPPGGPRRSYTGRRNP